MPAQMKQSSKHNSELFWPRVVMRKWLNISDKDSTYSADPEDDDDDHNYTDSDNEEFYQRVKPSAPSRFRDNIDYDAQVDPTDAFPRLRRRKSETFRAQYINTKELRICVGTWNVGGKLPPDDLDIDDWLDINEAADIYVLGLQEIVPLNAGNIFGAEDSRPVILWENIIREALNRIRPDTTKIKSFSDPPSPSKYKPPDGITDIEEEILVESDSDVGEEFHDIGEEVHPLNQERNNNDAGKGTEITGEKVNLDSGTDLAESRILAKEELNRQFSSPKRLDRLNCLRTEDNPFNAQASVAQPSVKLTKMLSGTERIGLSWPEPPLNLLSRHVLERPNSFKSVKSFKTSKSLRTFSSFKSNVNDMAPEIALLAEIDLESLMKRKRRSSYVRIVSKQMVGIFLTIWVRRSLRKHIQNLTVSTVGVGVMGYIGNKAVGRYKNDEQREWRPAEAALFCIRAISNYVSVVESEVMPQVMNLLPKLTQHPQLLQTVCLTIGAYSKWLDAASSGLSILPSVIDILTSAMGTSEESAAAAALAFRHICDDCRKKLCGYMEGLFHIYHRAINGEGCYKVSPEDSLHLVEALSAVITELAPDNAKTYLEALCYPVVSPLQEIVNQGPEVLNKKPDRELTVYIDRFAYIFRYVYHPEAVADAIQRLWPIFKAIFDVRAWDMRTMESLCRACKYAVRTSGRFMGITIGAILEEIQGLYQQHHQPCFLYLSSEVIKIFGSDPTCANYLRSLIEALFIHTTRLLTNIQEFTARPDIADDCFLLASRCVRYCPQLFIPSPVFLSIVDCSMIGITVQHREASNSILTFQSDIFDLANNDKAEQYLPIRDAVIIPRGAVITRVLVASLTGSLPSSRLESVIYTLLALTRAYRAQAVEWAKESVSLIPLTAVTEIERSRFLKASSDTASGADINSLTVPIDELSDVCRRNRTVQEIVQGALRPHELNITPVS